MSKGVSQGVIYPKYYSLNSNVIVTYGYDCENGVDESVKTMLILNQSELPMLTETTDSTPYQGIDRNRIICKIQTVIFKTIT